MGWLSDGRCAHLATTAPTICLIPFYAYGFPMPLCLRKMAHVGSLTKSVSFGEGLFASRSFHLTRLPILHVPLSDSSPKSHVHPSFTIVSFSSIHMSPNPPIHLHIIPNRSHTAHHYHSDMSHLDTVIIPNKFTLV
jgi:hypothetical protein